MIHPCQLEHEASNFTRMSVNDTISGLHFRRSYLTYLKLLVDLYKATELGGNIKKETDEDDDAKDVDNVLVAPSSHSLTQTDREYFNTVTSEDGKHTFVKKTT